MVENTLFFMAGLTVGATSLYLHKCKCDKARLRSRMANDKTQTAVILDHLERGKTITVDEAKSLYNISNLGSVLHALRRAGATIETTIVNKKGIYKLK